MLNLNIDYSTAVILNPKYNAYNEIAHASSFETGLESMRRKCLNNWNTCVFYDGANYRVLFRFAYGITQYKAQAEHNSFSPYFVVDSNVTYSEFSQNKDAYIQALTNEIVTGKLDDFLISQSLQISTRLTKAHATKKANKQH